MNGHLNGHANGSAHLSAGSSKHSIRQKQKSKGSYLGWIFDKSAKVAVWATLYTVVFRCPSTPADLTTSNSDTYVCKPYFQAREYLTPYAQPYYDQYLAHHVAAAEPYYNQFHKHVYTPGQAIYNVHAAPRVADAQKFGQEQWEKTVKPQLDQLSAVANAQYSANLAPHVSKAQEAVQPYYSNVQASANKIWTAQVEPLVQKAAPLAQDYASRGQQFAVETALPQAQVAGSYAAEFWARQVYPRLRVLYGENVEPQLLRITERLGRYRDGKKLQAEIKSIETSASLASASTSASSIAASVSSVVSQVANSPASIISEVSSSAAAAPKASVDPKVQFQADLDNWKTLSATAVEEGIEDLEERVRELTERQTTSQAEGVGRSLVIELEEAASSAQAKVKARTLQIVRALPDDPTDEQLATAEEDLLQVVRKAGQSLKQKAQDVRDWREKYTAETESLVAAALESTLETVSHIRELRLTEIGRKYAAVDSLPHKAWAKYNELKKTEQTSPGWRSAVKRAAYGHVGLAASRRAGVTPRAPAWQPLKTPRRSLLA